MQMAEPKHYAQIVYVLKRLIKLAERRALAWPYLEVAKELLEGFSDANCPISPDDLGWLLSESWNKGTRLIECLMATLSALWVPLCVPYECHSERLFFIDLFHRPLSLTTFIRRCMLSGGTARGSRALDGARL
jgi:hypothetical protein